MTKHGHIFLVIWMLFLGACSASQTSPTEKATLEAVSSPQGATITLPIPTPEAPTPDDIPGISPGQVRNAEYQLGLLDQIRVVQLEDGRYQEGAPGNTDYISISVSDFIARGDLNDDGENEAVAIVTENYGGIGAFVFVAVYQTLNDEPVFLTSIFLDDRPLINALSVEDGEIFVDAVIHDSDDPLCCPSLATTRHYLLNGLNLIMTSYSTMTPAGDARVITIEAPIDGIQVSGIIRLKGSITIAPFENSLVYRVYDLGGVALSIGPINVDAPALGAPGSFEKAIELGDILTNTTVRVTVEDLNIADGSLFAMDSVILQVR